MAWIQFAPHSFFKNGNLTFVLFPAVTARHRAESQRFKACSSPHRCMFVVAQGKKKKIINKKLEREPAIVDPQKHHQRPHFCCASRNRMSRPTPAALPHKRHVTPAIRGLKCDAQSPVGTVWVSVSRLLKSWKYFLKKDWVYKDLLWLWLWSDFSGILLKTGCKHHILISVSGLVPCPGF